MLSLLYCLSGHRESSLEPRLSIDLDFVSQLWRSYKTKSRMESLGSKLQGEPVITDPPLPSLLFVRTQGKPPKEAICLVHVLVLQARPNQPQHVSHTEKGLVMLCRFSCATLKFSCDQLILIQFWIVRFTSLSYLSTIIFLHHSNFQS